MATVELQVHGERVAVEVEPMPGQRPAGLMEEASTNFKRATNIIVDFATEFTSSMQALQDDARPETAELQFGLKINGEANWLVAKSGIEGNFLVTLTWKTQSNSK